MGFVTWAGHRFGKLYRGCYDGFIDAKLDSNKNSVEVPFIDQIPISDSEAGKRAINESLRPGCPDKVITVIDKVCTAENLSQIGCVQAMYYAVLAGASEVTRVVCTNLLI